MSDLDIKPGELTHEQHDRVLQAARFLAESLENMGCERPVVFYAYETKVAGAMNACYGRAYDRARVSEAVAEKNYELIGKLFNPQKDNF